MKADIVFGYTSHSQTLLYVSERVRLAIRFERKNLLFRRPPVGDLSLIIKPGYPGSNSFFGVATQGGTPYDGILRCTSRIGIINTYETTNKEYCPSGASQYYAGLERTREFFTEEVRRYIADHTAIPLVAVPTQILNNNKYDFIIGV